MYVAKRYNAHLLNKYALITLLFTCPLYGKSLGVLTHEAIIDAAWDTYLVPLLKEKYPGATADELKTAHAYAYGGSVCPDMGYYPLGSHLFTDLVHYARSGDMVDSLLRDAGNINQYAFALGFLSHYLADNYGHPMATNRSVPLVYKRMKKRFGDVITYGDNKISHLRMEFGFDVLQTAKGNYASQTYHDFIGFQIDTALLSKAFEEVYGLSLNRVYNNHLQSGINFFRYVVASFFPLITRSAWAARSAQLIKKDSTLTSRKFRYKMRLREYNKEYGKGYKHPGFFPSVLSVFIRILPKVGPTRALRFKLPTTEAEKYFDQSFDTIERHYSLDIKSIGTGHQLLLKDKDFDTGNPTHLCEYALADEVYAKWIEQLCKEKFQTTNAGMRQNILRYYQDVPPTATHTQSKKCKGFYTALYEMRTYVSKSN